MHVILFSKAHARNSCMMTSSRTLIFTVQYYIAGLLHLKQVRMGTDRKAVDVRCV